MNYVLLGGSLLGLGMLQNLKVLYLVRLESAIGTQEVVWQCT